MKHPKGCMPAFMLLLAVMAVSVLLASCVDGTYTLDGAGKQRTYVPVGTGFSDKERERLHRVMDTLSDTQLDYVNEVTNGIHPSGYPPDVWDGAYAWQGDIYFPHDWIYRADGSIGRLEEDDRFGRIMIHEACHLHYTIDFPDAPIQSEAEEDYCDSVAGYCGPVGRDPCDTPNKVY